MKFTITYRSINILYAVLAAVNALTFVASKLKWPTLPAFIVLIDGHPVLSLVVEVVLVAVGVAVQFSLLKRPALAKTRMIVYAVTLATALIAVFASLDMLFTPIRPH